MIRIIVVFALLCLAMPPSNRSDAGSALVRSPLLLVSLQGCGVGLWAAPLAQEAMDPGLRTFDWVTLQ